MLKIYHTANKRRIEEVEVITSTKQNDKTNERDEMQIFTNLDTV